MAKPVFRPTKDEILRSAPVAIQTRIKPIPDGNYLALHKQGIGWSYTELVFRGGDLMEVITKADTFRNAAWEGLKLRLAKIVQGLVNR